MPVGGLGFTLSTWSLAAQLGCGGVYFLLKPVRVKPLSAFMADTIFTVPTPHGILSDHGLGVPVLLSL